MSTQNWEKIAEAKRVALAASIPSQYRIPKDLLPPDSQLDVTPWPQTSGWFTKEELEVTGSTASDILRKIASKEWTSADVTKAFCKRAAAAHQLTNCLSDAFFEEAIESATALDDHFQRTGQLTGPLHGLPISLKDNFNIKGKDSTVGFTSLVDKPAEYNATLVDILQQLGAVRYCKTNVPTAMMIAESVNNTFGRTVNPLNRSLTSGGSSGGESALIAFGGSPLGVGTDIGGSLRIPAACTGIFTLRPSHGRFTTQRCRSGLAGQEAVKSVNGPMARTLEDITMYSKAVIDAKPWLLDPTMLPMPWQPVEPKQKLKIAVMWSDGIVTPTPPVTRALKETVQSLKRAGHDLIEWDPKQLHLKALQLLGRMFVADGGKSVEALLKPTNEPWRPEMKMYEEASELGTYDMWKLHSERTELQRQYLEQWMSHDGLDAILCPTTPYASTKHGDFKYVGYTGVYNVVDYSAVSFPSGVTADKALDTSIADYKALSELCQATYDSYDAEAVHGMPSLRSLPLLHSRGTYITLAMTVSQTSNTRTSEQVRLAPGTTLKRLPWLDGKISRTLSHGVSSPISRSSSEGPSRPAAPRRSATAYATTHSPPPIVSKKLVSSLDERRILATKSPLESSPSPVTRHRMAQGQQTPAAMSQQEPQKRLSVVDSFDTSVDQGDRYRRHARADSLAPIPPHLERSSTSGSIQLPRPGRSAFERMGHRRVSDAIEDLEGMVQEAVDIADDTANHSQVEEIYDIIEHARQAIQDASGDSIRHLMVTSSPLSASDSTREWDECSTYRTSPSRGRLPVTEITSPQPLIIQRNIVGLPPNLTGLTKVMEDPHLRPLQPAMAEVGLGLAPEVTSCFHRILRNTQRENTWTSCSVPSANTLAAGRTNGLPGIEQCGAEGLIDIAVFKVQVAPIADPYQEARRANLHEDLIPMRNSRLDLMRHHRRQPIARNWGTGKKRLTAVIACVNTALLGIIIGVYAGEVPRIQYYLADESHVSILGNFVLYLGLAVSTSVVWPLPLLHGRKPYILAALALAMPLQFPQAMILSARRSPNRESFRAGLLLARLATGLVLGFANVNYITVLFDLFGASLQSKNPHQEFVVASDVRRHGGGMGLWLGIWSWCWIASLAVGFTVGAVIIEHLSPDWGFYIVIIILAAALVLNIIAPETRRAAYRKSVTEVYDRDENYITRRVSRGESRLLRAGCVPGLDLRTGGACHRASWLAAIEKLQVAAALRGSRSVDLLSRTEELLSNGQHDVPEAGYMVVSSRSTYTIHDCTSLDGPSLHGFFSRAASAVHGADCVRRRTGVLQHPCYCRMPRADDGDVRHVRLAAWCQHQASAGVNGCAGPASSNQLLVFSPRHSWHFRVSDIGIHRRSSGHSSRRHHDTASGCTDIDWRDGRHLAGPDSGAHAGSRALQVDPGDPQPHLWHSTGHGCVGRVWTAREDGQGQRVESGGNRQPKWEDAQDERAGAGRTQSLDRNSEAQLFAEGTATGRGGVREAT
ncbi:hypothetical protein OPT61_g6159 [Boeremia exigua]|uniref:Uncharacterized protein n=1 Tax=Boeremia exigua TaxID=749465 RepID=A0ACC2I7P5_9PLEO|nr:hypothetical protein OPT61_g6159 [Boeremia exigua]